MIHGGRKKLFVTFFFSPFSVFSLLPSPSPCQSF